VDVCPVQLPGRERRISQKPYTAMQPLVEELAGVLRPYLDVPFAFFGHSMGALISFELARELRRTGAELPRWLFLSGARAPQVPSREPPIHDLPDAEFIQEIRQLNGTPAEVLEEPELLEMYLPLLRADVGLCERYTLAEEAPLEVPFSVYGGEQDADVLPEDLAAWRTHTTRRTQLRSFPGDHFFLAQHRERFLRSFSDDLFHAVLFAQRR
jgi:surfactin synthase thioesterase subunit